NSGSNSDCSACSTPITFTTIPCENAFFPASLGLTQLFERPSVINNICLNVPVLILHLLQAHFYYHQLRQILLMLYVHLQMTLFSYSSLSCIWCCYRKCCPLWLCMRDFCSNDGHIIMNDAKVSSYHFFN